VELFSTDLPPANSVALIEKDYRTRSCRCRIRDVACLVCGMFLSETVRAHDRLHPTFRTPITWAALPAADADTEGGTCSSPELGKGAKSGRGMAGYAKWCR
ncbi:Protein fam72b, partial [Gonapodya sp. JEL0774]